MARQAPPRPFVYAPLLFVAAGAGGGGAVLAAPRVPALQGDAVLTNPVSPGGATLGGSIGSPTINSYGRVGFYAGINGGLGGAGVLSDVALGNGGAAAGPLRAHARNNNAASGGGTLTGIGTSILMADNGGVAFTSLLNDTQDLGVWFGDAHGDGVVNLQARHAAVSPSSPPGTYIMATSIPFAMSRNGKMAFVCRFDATGTGFTYASLFSGATGSLTMHARQDTPPAPTGFTSFGLPQINNDGVACLAVNYMAGGLPPPQGTGGARTGVFTGSSGSLAGQATSLSPAVDQNGGPTFDHYTGFSSTGYGVNGDNSVVFLATLDSPVNPSGMYIFDSQGIREISRLHGPVNAVNGPGGSIPAGATFGFFDPPVICDNGDVYFMANLTAGVNGINSDNDTVLFRYRNRTLSVVAREGSQIPTQLAGRFFGFATTPIGANAFGQVVFTGQVLVPGGAPATMEAVFVTDRVGMPQVLYKAGDVHTVRGGLARTFSGFSAVLRSGGNDGRPQSINTRGEVALAASCNVAPGTPHGQNGRSIVVFDAPVGPCGIADMGSQGGLFGADGVLDNNDFIAFINLFFAGHPAADVGVQGGGAGSDGLFDNNDFIAFITAFFAGCT